MKVGESKSRWKYDFLFGCKVDGNFQRKKLSNLKSFPAHNIFQNRRQNRQRIAAEHRPLGDLGDVFRLGNRYGETVALVDVQHHMKVRAAVARIDDMIRPNLKLRLQLIEDRYLAVTGSSASNSVDFTVNRIKEFRAVDMILGNDSLQRGVDDLDRRGGENIKVELIAVNFVLQNLIE